MDDDGGDVRVHVEPGASHYYAGEIATFTISFTNTRVVQSQTPQTQTARPLIARTKSEDQINAYGRAIGHRRAFSSVSEARMARPPTSPGIRRVTPPPMAKYTPLTSSSLSQPTTTRKGLIGVKKQVNGVARSTPGRPLSIAIAPASALRDGEDNAVAVNGSGTPTTPTHRGKSLFIVDYFCSYGFLASPRRTRTTNGIPLSHPHARKQSAALDGAFPLASSHLTRVPPITPSTSSFSSSLPPITESNSLDTTAPPATPLRHTPDLSGPSTPYPDSPCTPTPPPPDNNTALILLAHAQVIGTLILEPPSAALAASWRVAELGSGRRVVGGGRMGIGVTPRPRAASGVGAWLGMSDSRNGPSVRAALGLGGLASADSSTASLASAPPDSPPTRPYKRGHQRATSMASYIPGMSSISALLSPFGDDTAVGADSEADAGQLRRVIRVPIRMYNHVSIGQIPRPYDLMWPIARRREGPMLAGSVEDSKVSPTGPGKSTSRLTTSQPPPDKNKLTRLGLESYARKLLVESNPNALAAELSKLRLSPGGFRNEDDESANMSCRDAVEVVTRHSKKVSYDIAKDGKTVAVITFVKASYRLGETILGAIEFNTPSMDGQVLKYSATLESTESFPLHTPAPQTRKHAEHHVAYASGAQRAAFSLDIPSDGTPTFVLRGGEAAGRGGIEGGLQWRVRMALVVCMAPSARARYLEPDGPRNEWGEAWRACGDVAPMGPADPKAPPTTGEGWGSFFRGWTGDEEPVGQEVNEGWTRLKPETIECELPIAVFPGSTAYQP
ncbi:hypothetical protein FRC11_003892, partial [Ceratobasidium sp. 423]